MKTCHVNEVCYFLYEVKGKCKEGGGGGGGEEKHLLQLLNSQES